jgi:hypothetical protein
MKEPAVIEARLLALWLTAGLSELLCIVEPILWQRDGLQASVRVNGCELGSVQAVYRRFRQDDFVVWLNAQLSR